MAHEPELHPPSLQGVWGVEIMKSSIVSSPLGIWSYPSGQVWPLRPCCVEIANLKNQLEDTVEQLALDKEFAAELDKSCATKSKEWEE